MLMNAAQLSSHMLARRASGIVPQKRDFELNLWIYPYHCRTEKNTPNHLDSASVEPRLTSRFSSMAATAAQTSNSGNNAFKVGSE